MHAVIVPMPVDPRRGAGIFHDLIAAGHRLRDRPSQRRCNQGRAPEGPFHGPNSDALPGDARDAAADGANSVTAGGGEVLLGAAVSGVNSPAPQGAFGTMVPGRNDQAPIPATAGRSLPMGPSSSQAVMPGENPTRWQYDVARNRHYNPLPGHQHWHNGPPPSDTSGALTVTGTNPTVSVGGGGSGGLSVSGGAITTPSKVSGSTMATSGSEPLKPGENPAPWEYDKARDRHYNPTDAHRHWHSGPPPPVSERR